MGSAAADVRHGGVDVSVIVITWNTRELLRGCLESLRDYLPQDRTCEIIVVDNGSTDGTQDWVREAWPQVQLIANPENYGFTRANNIGIREAKGASLLLINADAMITPGCVDEMLACLEHDPRAGIVGPRLAYIDGRFQRWTGGREPSLGAAVNFYFGLERLSSRFRGLYLGRDVGSPMLVDWVTSACMLVRRATLDQIGLMNEQFFVYMDDVDLCRRAREAGWHVWYWPVARATHWMGQSYTREAGAVSPRALRTFNRYFAMQHGVPAAWCLKLIEGTGHGLRAAAYRLAAASVGRQRPDFFLSRARAHWAYTKISLEPHVER